MNLVPLKVKYLPPFIHLIFWLFDKSAKITKINEPANIDKPKIFASWHGRQYCFLQLQPREKLNVLISQSNDGEIVTKVLKKLGFSVIRGSASRGGMKAVKKMLEALEDGGNIAFTVDGPRGPIYEVKMGIVKLAQKSGAPIIPVVPATGTKLVVRKSWDKYNLPLFFSDIKYYFGEPVYVDKDCTDDEQENIRMKLEMTMKKMTFEADKDCHCKKSDLD